MQIPATGDTIKGETSGAIGSILQVSIEDAELADKAFEELMGDDVQKRREFIEANATAVANLDI